MLKSLEMENYTGFEACTPESVGITSASILNLIDESKRRGIQLHSLMLLRHGKVAAQCWWKPYAPEYPHHLYSFSKSITATAVGFAFSEGLLRPEDRVVSFFPRRIKENTDARMYSMTVEHLLTMTSGAVLASEATMQLHVDWVEWFLNTPLFSFPGDKFVYNSMNTYMLSAILRKVTGVGLVDYLYPRLFEPLGIERPEWKKCPLGVECGGWGLSLKTEDMAKFAQLYLDDGMWKGKRVLPEGWAKQVGTKHVETGSDDKFSANAHSRSGYGYQFWINAGGDSYRADGLMAQYGIIMPKKDMVIITTAGTTEQIKVLDLIWDTLMPYIDVIPEGSDTGEDYDELCLVCRNLALELPKAADRARAVEKLYSGRDCSFPANISSMLPLAIRYLYGLPMLGMDSVRFDFDDEVSTMTWHEDGEDHILPFRLDGNYSFTEVNISSRTIPVAVYAAWIAADILEVDIRLINTPHMLKARFRFAEDSLVYTFDEDPSLEDSFRTVLNLVSVMRPASGQMAKIAEKVVRPLTGKFS